jgi:nuclear receptor subfamily 1 group D protein 3
LGLFSAIVLLTADRPGVTDLKTIEHHQDRLIDALKVQVSVIGVTYTDLLVSVKEVGADLDKEKVRSKISKFL